MKQQTEKLTYPHRHFDVISDINSLLDKIQANKQVFMEKEVSEHSIKDLKHLLDGIENLEALRKAIGNQIQW